MEPAMGLVYLDNNVIAKEIENGRLLPPFGPGSVHRLAVSVWNLVEIAKHGDKNEAIRRAALLDASQPRWLFNARDIQAEEVMSFLFTLFYKVPYPAWSPFSNSLSGVMWKDMAAQMPIVAGATGWVKEHHGRLPAIDLGDQVTVDALNTRRAADPKALREAEPETFRQWVGAKIATRLPIKVPGQGSIAVNNIPMLVDFCWSARQAFYRHCPSMAVEDKFAFLRASDRLREPRPSDGRDLQHGISSLPYCQHLISGDGFLRQCSSYAKEQLPSFALATVYKDFDEFLKRVTDLDPAA
jgi:hypothetical protein